MSLSARAAKNVLPVDPAISRSSAFIGVAVARFDMPDTSAVAVPSSVTMPSDAPGDWMLARHSSSAAWSGDAAAAGAFCVAWAPSRHRLRIETAATLTILGV